MTSKEDDRHKEWVKLRNEGKTFNECAHSIPNLLVYEELEWALKEVDDTTRRVFALACAERVLALYDQIEPDDDSLRIAVQTGLSFVMGAVNEEDLKDAIAIVDQLLQDLEQTRRNRYEQDRKNSYDVVYHVAKTVHCSVSFVYQSYGVPIEISSFSAAFQAAENGILAVFYAHPESRLPIIWDTVRHAWVRDGGKGLADIARSMERIAQMELLESLSCASLPQMRLIDIEKLLTEVQG